MKTNLKDENDSIINKIKSMDNDMNNMVKSMMDKKYSSQEKMDILVPKMVEIVKLLNNALKDEKIKSTDETFLFNLKQKWICYAEFYRVSHLL